MKNKFTFIGLVSFTLLLISCSPDDPQEENLQTEQVSTSLQNGAQYDNEGNPLNPKDKG